MTLKNCTTYKNPLKPRRRLNPAIMAAVLCQFWPFPPRPTKTPPAYLPSPFVSTSSALVSTGKFGSLRCGTPAGRPAVARGGTALAMAASNVVIAPEENEPDESLVRRFRSKVLRAGVIQECKRRRFFETKQEERKRKAREAAKRNSYRKRRPRKMVEASEKQEAKKTKKVEDEEEDNWEVPEVLPY